MDNFGEYKYLLGETILLYQLMESDLRWIFAGLSVGDVIKNKKEIDNIYINCYSVIDMIKDEEKTKVIFSDFSELIVNQPIRLLTKYYDNGLKIKKSNEMIF